MRLAASPGTARLLPSTADLLERTLCPLSGIAPTVGFVVRGRHEPRVAIAGGEMTGIHVLRGTPVPPPGAYHIGGSGTTFEETVVHTLGETLERYAQLIAVHAGRHPVELASRAEMAARRRRCLGPEDLRRFSDDQHARRGFPFERPAPDAAVGWVEAPSLTRATTGWVVAQEALVGYLRRPGEPRFALGVSTGTATHRTGVAALRNALLELVQIDAAMGHWYGHGEATVIEPGRRTAAFDALCSRALDDHGPRPRLALLGSAGLPGFAVVCLLESGGVPACAAGLGCDLSLEAAMRKAFLEAVAVAQLAKVILFRQAMADGDGARPPFYDLDSNVGHYALDPETVRRRFARAGRAGADDLPPDGPADDVPAARRLVRGFAEHGMDLAVLDLTTADIRALGCRVIRAYSPDTISLPLPSAPPLLHPRFEAYGGVGDDAPHPYP